MQSPFTRLKRYRPDVVDQRENHATECLAACLQFSVDLREIFLNFLFDRVAVKPPSAASLEVQTQQFVGEFGVPDLVLSEEGHSRIVVEVKVGAQLRVEQAKKYGRWLSEHSQPRQYLFSLEQEPRHVFSISEVSKIPGARTRWRDLYRVFRVSEKTFAGTTEGNLIAAMCGYLEDEGIVSTWSPSQILALGPAIQAKAALGHCFARVEDRLKESGEPFITKVVMPSAQWPRLEIGLPVWEKKFGEGYQGRVWAFYTVEGVWDSEVGRFYFCFFVWDCGFPSEWAVVEKKLPAWGKALEAQGFAISVNLGNRREAPGAKGMSGLKEPPKSVEVWYEDEMRSYINADKIRSMTDEELVTEMVARMRELCEVISTLK